MTLGHLLYMHMYQISFLSPLGFQTCLDSTLLEMAWVDLFFLVGLMVSRYDGS